MSEQQPKSWFKQAWPWFVFSIPVLTVIAGIITYQIAAERPHSMVQDDYFKKGLAINQSLAKQEQAKLLGLNADLQVDKQSQLLSVKLHGQTQAASLQLMFSHPTQEKLDQLVSLSLLSSDEFVAQMPELPQAHWHIRLTDNQQSWLLKDRWHYPEMSHITIGANSD